MDSSARTTRRIVVDAIHGDIALGEQEWRIVDTASFQRLRFIKQLGMGHLVYPNATHTRFAHSLGVFGIMNRILRTARENDVQGLTDESEADLRLAALLHDVGHYPYSHLMETVEYVKLAEELVRDAKGSKQTLKPAVPYPTHVKLGQLIVCSQADLGEAIGTKERAERVAGLFGRTTAANPQWSKLISSSFDMDRLDYLLRDSRAAGVPYGEIDLNYLLNSLRVSPNGLLGVNEKALLAAEQYLFARYFMHRTVYWHKTTCAFEEAARQLIRRIRDQKPAEYDLPPDGTAVEERVRSGRLRTFTDAYLDALIEKAASDRDEAIATIAVSILDRRPPKLLHEVCDLQEGSKAGANSRAFKQDCRHKLAELAREVNLPLWRFMYWETSSPLRFEKRGRELSAAEARGLQPEEADELIKVFHAGSAEPISLVDLTHSILSQCAGFAVRLCRLYVVDDGVTNADKYEELRKTVRQWGAD